MGTIKFQLRSKRNPANIYLRLTVDRETNIRRKTGYSIDPDDWSKKTSLPKKNDADLKNLNTNLNYLANEVEKRLNIATSKGTEITGDWLQQQIDAILNKKKNTDADQL